MSNYGSIKESNDDSRNTEVDALIGDRIPVVDRPSPSSKKWYLAGGLVTFLLLMVASRSSTQNLNAELLDNGSICSSDESCKSDVCCTKKTLFGRSGNGKCCDCNDLYDCINKIKDPPVGTYGEPFCVNNECQAYANGEFSQIPEEGFTVWSPSETIDNSKEYRKYIIPRNVYSDVPATPVFDHVWYIDFNDQDSSFNKDDVIVSETNIQIPKNSMIHAGYSKSYHMYDEHETGITTLIMSDNTFSMVADYPKVSFVEKYHTLTYEGKKDTARGDHIKKLSDEQMKQEWSYYDWWKRAVAITFGAFRRKTINAQVEGGIDRVQSWNIRRYVRSYPKEDFGTLNPRSSSSWASHAEKAKQAINYAKDPNFKREYKKSEQHCKHMEEIDGVDYTDTHVIFPFGRPIITFSGEMVTSPVTYLGLIVGHITVDYDNDANVLQIYYQGFSVSRQYMDVGFPGPYGGNGLYLSPVAEGSDYVVDPGTDGRTDIDLIAEQPPDDLTNPSGEADFSMWARPLSETCPESSMDDPFWENINPSYADDSIFDFLLQNYATVKGTVRGMPCSSTYMRADYGKGTHGYSTAEMGVWAHFLSEVPSEITKYMGTAKWWDSWKCHYQNLDQALCE